MTFQRDTYCPHGHIGQQLVLTQPWDCALGPCTAAVLASLGGLPPEALSDLFARFQFESEDSSVHITYKWGTSPVLLFSVG